MKRKYTYTPMGWQAEDQGESTHWPDVVVVLVGILLFVVLAVRIPL